VAESPWTYSPEWTEVEREEWKRAYAAGEPVLLPHPGHDEGECAHCDVLRALMYEVDCA
jgi:hypothetical protein